MQFFIGDAFCQWATYCKQSTINQECEFLFAVDQCKTGKDTILCKVMTGQGFNSSQKPHLFNQLTLVLNRLRCGFCLAQMKLKALSG